MLSLVTFSLIYVGVLISIYQIYSIYSEQIFGDHERKTGGERRDWQALSAEAQQYAQTGAAPGFVEAVRRLFGGDLDPRVALAAFAGGKQRIDAEPLLRRKRHIICNGRIRVRHPGGWKTDPPRRNLRGLMLAVIILNSLIVIFLGGLSVYTIGYQVSAASFAWVNDEGILMLLIYSIIAVTHLVARLDAYLHDLYRIGQLNRYFDAEPGSR